MRETNIYFFRHDWLSLCQLLTKPKKYMETTFKFESFELMFNKNILAVIAEVYMYKNGGESLISRPRKSETICDQNGSKFFIQDKIVDKDKHKLVLVPAKTNIETFDINLQFVCLGKSIIEHIPLDHISEAIQHSSLGGNLEREKTNLNFPSTYEEKKANSQAIKQIQDIITNIDRPAQSKETQYALKALEEAGMWLSRRNIEITRNK